MSAAGEQLARFSRRQVELSVAAVLVLAMVALVIIVQELARQDRAARAELAAPAPVRVMPDFAFTGDVAIKKQQFFDYLEDYVVAEINAITRLRDELGRYAAVAEGGIGFSDRERQWLLDLAKQYRLETDRLSDREIINELMRRVDVLPVSLVLAQAANESAWGTSRFALEGYNLFGQWCYRPGCGMIPAERSTVDRHEVRSFDSVAGSVKAYFLNINTHPFYAELRNIRAALRERDAPLNPLSLLPALERYSEQGESYLDEIQAIILQNGLRGRDV